MVVSCKHCGAPLDVEARAAKVRCRYCGAVSKLRKLATLHAQTPPGWAPPPTWTPPPEPPPHEHAFGAQEARALAAAIALTTLIPLAALGFRALLPSGCAATKRVPTVAVGRPPLPDPEPPIDDTVRTIDCRGDDVVHQTGTVGEVRASGRCKLVLTDPKLDKALTVHDDAVVEIHAVKGASIEGAARSLDVEDRATVTLHGKVVLRGSITVEPAATLVAPHAVHERGHLFARPGSKVVGLAPRPEPPPSVEPPRAPPPRAPRPASPPKPPAPAVTPKPVSPARPALPRPTPR